MRIGSSKISINTKIIYEIYLLVVGLLEGLLVGRTEGALMVGCREG